MKIERKRKVLHFKKRCKFKFIIIIENKEKKWNEMSTQQ